jgi:hypothetical protein
MSRCMGLVLCALTAAVHKKCPGTCDQDPLPTTPPHTDSPVSCLVGLTLTAGMEELATEGAGSMSTILKLLLLCCLHGAAAAAAAGLLLMLREVQPPLRAGATMLAWRSRAAQQRRRAPSTHNFTCGEEKVRERCCLCTPTQLHLRYV